MYGVAPRNLELEPVAHVTFPYGDFAVETDFKHTKSFKKYIVSM